MLLGEFIVTDDSGLIGVVNPPKYAPFVEEDWHLNQLLDHFLEANAEGSLLVWSAGSEGDWRVSVVLGATETKGFREVVGYIESGERGLWLVSYGSLTMAAQFADEPLPQPHESHLNIPLAPGLYLCRIVQLFDPTDISREPALGTSAPHFLLEFTPHHGSATPWHAIPWLALQP